MRNGSGGKLGSDKRDVDTKFYWKLTPHIFRYGHTEGAVGGTLLAGVHTVNEGKQVNVGGALLDLLYSNIGFEPCGDHPVLHGPDSKCGRVSTRVTAEVMNVTSAVVGVGMASRFRDSNRSHHHDCNL